MTEVEERLDKLLKQSLWQEWLRMPTADLREIRVLLKRLRMEKTTLNTRLVHQTTELRRLRRPVWWRRLFRRGHARSNDHGIS